MLVSFSSRGQDLLYQGFTRADGFTMKENQCLEYLEFSSRENPETIDIPFSELEWDEIDWKIFDALSPSLRLSYSDLSQAIGLGWRPIKTRIDKRIIPACHIATYFFPRGQRNYQQLYLQFKTEYQRNFLRKLDFMQTTNYFLLFGNNAGIFMFPENINKVLKTFKKIEKEGIIDDLTYFLPLEWYHFVESGWPGASTRSSLP